MKSKQQAEAAPVGGQHTPGPWRLAFNNAADGWTVEAGHNDYIGHTAAFTPRPGSNERTLSRDEAEANARLIAAAPTLLEALKKCKAAVENGNLPPSARMELVRDYATPTIAAAEGRAA